MAVNNNRSMNSDLRTGVLDGKFKSITPGRGGEVEREHALKRMLVLQEQYGMVNQHDLAHYAEAIFDHTLGTA